MTWALGSLQLCLPVSTFYVSKMMGQPLYDRFNVGLSFQGKSLHRGRSLLGGNLRQFCEVGWLGWILQ